LIVFKPDGVAMKQVLLPLLTLLLTGCGYGWKEESPIYPPSAPSGEVVSGQVVASAGQGEYVVQPGDTLYAIGFRNQLDYRDLASWNGIGSDYLIRAGQVLRLTAPAQLEGVQSQPLAQADVQTSVPQPVPIPAPTPIIETPEPVPVAAPVPVVVVPKPKPPAANTSVRWQWPTAGNVIKTYNPAAGSKGIDINGELGQPVLTVAAGKVVYSGSALKGYGELIIVKHDDTYLSAYGHNRRRLVKEGDEVRAGQAIAELGTGPEQKPLLHFEIRENGKPVDPLRFLPIR